MYISQMLMQCKKKKKRKMFTSNVNSLNYTFSNLDLLTENPKHSLSTNMNDKEKQQIPVSEAGTSRCLTFVLGKQKKD